MSLSFTDLVAAISWDLLILLGTYSEWSFMASYVHSMALAAF